MDEKKTAKKNKKNKAKEQVSPEVQARREAYDWIQSLISALLICVLVFVFVIRNDNKALVKRVIAVAGDTVNIDFDNGIVYVNGEAIEEAYLDGSTNNKLDFIGPQTVPENCLFVMGDNRNASTDSRDKRIGMVDKRLVIGKVLLVVYPFSDFGGVE